MDTGNLVTTPKVTAWILLYLLASLHTDDAVCNTLHTTSR